MAVSKRLRFEILRRDNHACRYCGGTAPDVRLTVDHVIPTALGGTDDPANLVTACADCNSGKSSVPAGAELVADVAADALRWAAAMQVASDRAAEKREKQLNVERVILAFWQEAKAPYRNESFADYMPGDWYLSVQRWIASGLTEDDLLEASHITIYARRVKAGDAWKYMCGVSWRMLTERQEQAREIVTAREEPPKATGPSGEMKYAAIQYCELSTVCDGEVG